ncbi:metallophosphoesterase family protein [Haloprofundus marisrubri]|uniref:metallophosphoesterase family protein n=1 Tax=Haloprofundus marisrubri TaxID=1514971 RepID=UPI0009E4DA4E
MICPVSGCEYTGPIASVAAHVSGKKDQLHNWRRLGYDGANDFKQYAKTGSTELPPELVACPVKSCEYIGEIRSVGGHVSGKRDALHDWRRLGYDGHQDFQRRMESEGQQANQTSILHMTDSHLGKKKAGSGRYQRSINCAAGFEEAVALALSRDVDAVVHTGDLFHNDRHGITDSTAKACRRQLKKLRSASIPFYYILGNHERDEGTTLLKRYQSSGLVSHLSCSPTVVGDSVALYGVDFTRADDWNSSMLDMDPCGQSNVLLTLHQSVEPYSPSENAIGTIRRILRQASSQNGFKFDALALGHLHKQFEKEVENCVAVCGGSTAPIGYRKSDLKPSVGIFSFGQSGTQYQRRQIQ